MPETHELVADIERLNAIEKQIIERFIHRQRAARDLSQAQKLDELRDQKWVDLMKAQEQQLALLRELASHGQGKGAA